ncbi:MAG TPA: hypothetical protein VER17_15095 [Tepidisphaeraceae bacterium]|nr:hypothetical protein [Tepidisphaeraceae bacterium]
MRMLPGGPGSGAPASPPAGPPAPTSAAPSAAAVPQRPAGAAATVAPGQGGIIPANQPARQLSELPKDELENLAEELGLDSSHFKTRQQLVTAIHERRQGIAALDRDAMLDVIKWGRRPVTYNASKEQIAQEIVRIRSMKFAGLSHRGLIVLARMRGLPASPEDTVPNLIRRLKKQEGLFSKLNRKRRSMLGSMVSKMLGEDPAATDYQFLPQQSPGAPTASGPVVAPPSTAGTIKDEIEESGLFGGIAGRIKKSADAYVNQKLDEIESRIDRKLDEIDRRLAEWRDKEIANRIRILKITLWASIVVGAISLIYSYLKLYIWPS